MIDNSDKNYFSTKPQTDLFAKLVKTFKKQDQVVGVIQRGSFSRSNNLQDWASDIYIYIYIY